MYADDRGTEKIFPLDVIPRIITAAKWARVGDGWQIIRRNMVKQWHRGPFPGPSLGPPIYPRSH